MREAATGRGVALHVMFLAQCYAPEDVSAAVLITELAEDVARDGHRVTVVTAAPSHPRGRVFAGYRNAWWSAEQLGPVRVLRTWSFISPSRSFVARLLHQATWSVTALFGGLRAGRPDVVVSYSPPLPLGLSAWALATAWRVPWVLQLEDLHPDAAVAAGLLRNHLAIGALRILERRLYRRASHISVIAESFRGALEEKGVPPAKLSVIPVWADPSLVPPLPRENAFRAAHGLSGAFVLLYAGNLGHTSCLDGVIEAAALLREDARLRLVVVGEGVRRPALLAEARSRSLHNVLFLEYQPRAAFAEMLAAADVALVTLQPAAARSSLPSKVFNHMSSARPVLAVAPSGSELAQVISRAGCGVTAPPDDPQAIALAIRRLEEMPPRRLEEMGHRGREELLARFSRDRCATQYLEMLGRVCGEWRAAEGVQEA